MDLSRTIVIGNAGSGKSWLAARIARHFCASWVDLDMVHWEPGGFNVPRKQEEAIALLKDATVYDRWVVEGIYGRLVEEITTAATALVWLTVAESECIANIRRRGIRRGGTAENLAGLLQWAGTYQTRSGSSSHAAHERIFNRFQGEKTCLSLRDEVTEFAERIVS